MRLSVAVLVAASVVAMSVVGCAPSKTPTGGLIVPVPADWKLTREQAGALDFYSATAGGGEGVLMLHKSPGRASMRGIKKMLSTMKSTSGLGGGFPVPAGVELSDEMREQAAHVFDALAKQPIVRLSGEVYDGYFVACEVEDTTVAMFGLDVGGELWQGQFTGSPARWIEARRTLESIRFDPR